MTRLRRAIVARIRKVAATPDAGASTAEMALLTPLLVAILLFVVMCGRLVSAQIDVEAAASSGARTASLLGHGGGVAEAERNALATLAAHTGTCRSASVTVSGNPQPGGSVTVRVSCRVALSDLLLLGVPGSRTVEASATSPVDRWAGP
ncbi:Flp pilus assembly protein TadG [Actinoplanes lutulentus]|uniref:TadE-like protein n=1 Tax=Actinoplanes lutulentus TaxID=1287878 RepID=A0A327Z1M6_9ACTN|nr:TadE/TadG family type IV pilus assembly protein [Actinoplanes lutulentus]MBB2943255.1 Flp pilus assembly protein TadG [Actinoplanes lutulentus]RAK28316.1 TadE-like protein [Actinoplanes lutulentus]